MPAEQSSNPDNDKITFDDLILLENNEPPKIRQPKSRKRDDSPIRLLTQLYEKQPKTPSLLQAVCKFFLLSTNAIRNLFLDVVLDKEFLDRISSPTVYIYRNSEECGGCTQCCQTNEKCCPDSLLKCCIIPIYPCSGDKQETTSSPVKYSQNRSYNYTPKTRSLEVTATFEHLFNYFQQEVCF
jgi:hypothetical protein